MRAISSRSPIRRATLALAGVAVIGTVAAGCGSSSKGGGDAAGLPTAPVTTTTEQPPVTGTPSSTPSTETSDTPSDTPSSSSSGDASGRASEYENVLLSASEVSDITGEDFTQDPSDTSSDAASEPSGCAALDDFVTSAKDAEDGKATASFTSADQSQQAEEQITYVPDQAETLFTQLKDAVSSCDTIGTGDNALQLSVQDDPEVSGADDTLAFTASATASGKSIAVTGYLARFGDTIVQVTYSAITDGDTFVLGDEDLLSKAASKAESVLA